MALTRTNLPLLSLLLRPSEEFFLGLFLAGPAVVDDRFTAVVAVETGEHVQNFSFFSLSVVTERTTK